MKNIFTLFFPLVLLAFAAVVIKNNPGAPASFSPGRPASIDIMECAPVAVEIYAMGADGKFIPLLPGWGDHAYSINTRVDSAQVYFNQGLSMYYSYHAREATASFKEAARFDSSCAMLYWAQALSMGPSYNFGYSYKMKAEITAIIKNMNLYASTATPKEKDLVEAMNKR
jgi:hypothetical protein